ncbi:MAG: hypothetical protein V8R62_12630 [Faecalibacillus intestinalis]
MIEEIVFNYLKNKLNVPVTFENINEVEYVLIGKSGSSRFDSTNTATFFIQSYSSSKYKASLLNEKVKDVMYDLIELDEITSLHLNSDYDYTDTTIKKYRYQALFDIGYF